MRAPNASPQRVLEYAAVRSALESLTQGYGHKQQGITRVDPRSDGTQVARLRRCELIGDYLQREITGREGPVGNCIDLESTVDDLTAYLAGQGIRKAPSTIALDARAIMRSAGARIRFRDEAPRYARNGRHDAASAGA